MTSTIETILRNSIAARVMTSGHSISRPLFAIDESANHPRVNKLAHELVSKNVCCASEHLWVGRREYENGKRTTVMGALPPKSWRVKDYGKAVKHWSWPDRLVVEFIAVKFGSHDRIVVLTENTKRDREGLWYILHNELRPIIETYGQSRLGFLLLAKRGKTDYATFCVAVREHLLRESVSAGFHTIKF